MQGATHNEKQLEKNKNDPHKSKGKPLKPAEKTYTKRKRAGKEQE